MTARSKSDPDLSKRARGRWGEDVAARHYARAGYALLDRNWRSATGELDLVVERDGVIVFSEVKARRTEAFGPAAAAVTLDKQRRIRLLAIEWLRANERSGTIRFDVVAVTGTTIEVIEDAF